MEIATSPQSNQTKEAEDLGIAWLSKNRQIPSQLQKIFIHFYHSHGRDLPWRASDDPYHIFVAEVLLQKTNSRQVEKVWPTLIDSYPDFKSLADANLASLNQIISSLGIHKRGGRMKQAAEKVITEAGGELPADPVFIGSLPGIGLYATSALLSLAFGANIPMIDVNIARMYSRLTGFIPNTLRQAIAFAQIIAEEVVTGRDPEFINYGTLDLSSILCRGKPICDQCPLVEMCCYQEDEFISS